MRVLYDCFSCSPYYGSDEGIGWMWPYHMRKHHEVWALVRKDRKTDIEKYCAENNINDIHFIYCDIPDWINFYYKNLEKGKNGVLDFLLYQYLWQFAALKAAKKADKQFNFDVVHHVSTNDFRLLGRLYKLKKTFIIGPVGGAQETPETLYDYVKRHNKSEKLRGFLNKILTSLPSYKNALKKAKKIYFSNCETFEYLKDKVEDLNKCEYLTEIGCSEIAPRASKPKNNMKFTFMWAGRMEYRKGLEFLFDVLELLPKDGTWELMLCGDGTERTFYEKLSKEKQLEEYVSFLGKLPYEKVMSIYKSSNVFVFPSLRETTGTVIIEAMANNMPVIAINQGGAKFVITDDTGFLISGNTKEEYIHNFAETMIYCLKNPDEVTAIGQRACSRIAEFYTWEKKIADILPVYEGLINKPCSKENTNENSTGQQIS